MYNHKSSFRDSSEPKIAARSNKWRFWLEQDPDFVLSPLPSPNPNNSSLPSTSTATTTTTTTTTTSNPISSNVESENDTSQEEEEVKLIPIPDKSAFKHEYLKDLVSSPIFSNRATIIGFATMNCDDKAVAKVLLFKSWIEPVWEDKHNLNGGRFFLRCPTRAAGKELFLRMVNMAMRGDLLPGDAYLCGLGFNTKKNSSECSVQLWHAQLPDSTAFSRLRAQMKHFHCSKVGYHPHSRSSVANGNGKRFTPSSGPEKEKGKSIVPSTFTKNEDKFSADDVQAALDSANALLQNNAIPQPLL
eukprot:TRINITY_DN17397_c0_g1_i1.p1 TRINITY_DN17397_c0_g1~~TRINITY_DN17397_c0_g1_i1.p1  ORF type:complete len:302 (-),score=63.61 TRINITY_DN17397_c0_g1_i1:20-925(-)